MGAKVDEELLVGAASGDRDAVDAVLARVRPLVMRRCARILPHREDAEEACQDALLAVSLKLSSYRGQGAFEAWVGAIATNQARMTYRSLKRRSIEHHDSFPTERPDPGRVSVIVGTRLDFLEAIDRLESRHPDLAETFVLRDLAEMSYADISDILDLPQGTIRTRVSRARDFVRTELER